MTLAGSSNKTDWFCPRCHKEFVFQSVLRSGLFVICLVVVLSMYPLLRPLGVHIHSAITGSYIPGHHSILLVNCPNEQAAKDIGRAIMERRMAASINILPRTSTMYYWKGDIQDATEILMMVMTRTSNIPQLTEYVRSVHPYEIPEILSFPVDGGSLAYLKWMDEAMPND
ncbi:protein CutA homolog [Osmerus mordax]|uniref:CutA homolog n=1 Tax=Osmerus mordax TaxID=8014 RepID=C1BK41_OSMMO|nr:CutA homolog precursor [Osmerus mordax]